MIEITCLFLLLTHIYGINTEYITSTREKFNQLSKVINDIENNKNSHTISAENRQDRLSEYHHHHPNGIYEPSSILQPHPFILPYTNFNELQAGYNSIPLSENIRNDEPFRLQAIESLSPQNIETPSHIYYIRLPSTPYIFSPNLPSLSYAPSIPNDVSAGPILNTLSPSLNIPVNFISNGKPQSVYQFGANPFYSNPSNFHSQPITNLKSSSFRLRPDSKIYGIKNSFSSNGKPEEVYIIPSNNNNHNNLNPNSDVYL